MQHITGPARLLAALGNEHRLEIVGLLRGGERCVCEITPAFVLDPSVVSRHLAILERAGAIRARREGRRIFYRLADRRLPGLLDAVRAIADRPSPNVPAARVKAGCCPETGGTDGQ
ncbi:MAG: metalloregulator ArsR/SmtB family transcription factor [bacterium]